MSKSEDKGTRRTNFGRLLLATAFAITIHFTAQAQEQPELRLSLAEAQQYAVEHNYSLQNASLEVKKAEYSRWQTLASMLPQVKAAFDYQNMCGYEMVMGEGAMAFHIPMDPTGTFSVTASIALTGSQIVGTMLQDIAKQTTEINQKQSELTTRSQVRSIYVSILVMEDIVGLLDSSLNNMNSLMKTTEESVRAGAAEQISADKLMVQVASLRSSINANRRSLQMLYNSLILQMGADVNSRIRLTTKLDEVLDMNYLTKLGLSGFNIEDNYNYQLLQKSEEIANKNITMALMEFTPTLSFFYQYSKKYYFGDEGMNMTPPNMIGAGISLPLFSSGVRFTKVESAKIDYTEAVNSKKQAEDGLMVQFNQAVFDLANAIETYQIQKENLDVTKRVFNNTTEKYKYGRASNLEVTNASTDIITAQSNYIQAVMSVVCAEVALENLLGK